MSRPGGAQGVPPLREARRRSRAALATLGAAGAFVVLVLIALGAWQVQRLSWKTDLIARVEARLAAEPIEAPGPLEWAGLTTASDEYRRVVASGVFLHDGETLVQALTERGAGFWVMTPLRRADGTILLVNRGFVPQDRRDRSSRAEGETAGTVRVAGLLRMSEPGGGFLRSNDPAADRWYSRDVAAIAAKRLSGERVGPYFIDLDATPQPGGLPVGGLTVVAFRNHHLVYALTWFGLAGLLAGAMVWVVRDERRRARGRDGERSV